MIKNTILIEIKKKLDQNNHLSSTDFEIQKGTKTVKIVYQYDDNYFFEVNIPDSISRLTRPEKETRFGSITTHKDVVYEAYEFSGTMRPGKISEVERLNFEGEQTLFSKISEWQNNLWSELTLKPELRRITELEDEIQKFKEKYENITDDFFTSAEVISLNQRLSDLEQKFREKLESEIDDKNKLEARIDELHSELEKLRSQSSILNKKNWFISFGAKIMTWLSKEENRKLLKDAKELMDEFIPDSK